MLLVCWKIAYIRGIKPALAGPSGPAGQLGTGPAAGFQTQSRAFSNDKGHQLRTAGRLSRLVPLSSIGLGLGLALYLDPGLPQTTEKQEETVSIEQATTPETQMPRWEELRNQLQHFELREKWLNAELQMLRALKSKSRDSMHRQKELSTQLDLLHQQRTVVMEEAKEEILCSTF
ncbi:hypothetical protein WJX73_009368 [Symbiochloris irregularis]|uniref:Uncharacterized protein n=1 Tax=Symbiochloris irregularis TaxID=706552 RepID=A0AAW1PSV5_9CHLO